MWQASKQSCIAGHSASSIRLRRPSSAAFNLLVLVDQFEEIFTYAEAGGAQADESEAFVNLLLASRADPASRIHVAITMRTNFLGNCVRFLDLPEAINKAQYLTPRLTRDQLEKAIVGPARVFGGDVEARLLPELVNSVARNPDQLPILQHALARMWDIAKARNPDEPIIDIAALDAVGGVGKALELHAEEVLSALSVQKLSQAANRIPVAWQLHRALGGNSVPIKFTESLFRAITERRAGDRGGQLVRRPQTLERIAEWTGYSWQSFVPIIEAFSAKGVHFLQYGRALTQDSVIDISHEALIRQWGRLERWVVDEAERADAYKEWRSREAQHGAKRTGPLAGADLARALEWLGTVVPPNVRPWRPTEPWAHRYAHVDMTANKESADAATQQEFERVKAFIEASASEAMRAEREAAERQAREQKIERDRLEALAIAAQREHERATAVAEAEREREQTARFLAASKRQSRRFAWVAALAVLCAGAAVILAYNSKVDRDRANAASHQAEVDRKAAIEAQQAAETNQASELEQRKLAEKAKGDAEEALKRARQADATTKQVLAATAGALKKQQSAVEASNQATRVADEQRALAQSRERDARDALRQATAPSLAIEGPAIATQARSGSTLLGALMARVAHRYQPGGEAYWGLLETADYLHRTQRIIETRGAVSSVAFSPDGKRIVSGSEDNTLRRWPMREVLDAIVCAKLPRNMTREEWKRWVGDLPYRRQCPDLPGPPDDP